MLMQENAVRRRRTGRRGQTKRGGGVLGKLLWQETRQRGPGKKNSVCVYVCSCTSVFVRTTFHSRTLRVRPFVKS